MTNNAASPGQRLCLWLAFVPSSFTVYLQWCHSRLQQLRGDIEAYAPYERKHCCTQSVQYKANLSSWDSLCTVCVFVCTYIQQNRQIALPPSCSTSFSPFPSLLLSLIIGFLAPVFICTYQRNETHQWWNEFRTAWKRKQCHVLVNAWHFTPTEYGLYIVRTEAFCACVCGCKWVCVRGC